MERKAEEEEQRREAEKRRAKMNKMSTKLAAKTSLLAKAHAGGKTNSLQPFLTPLRPPRVPACAHSVRWR